MILTDRNQTPTSDRQTITWKLNIGPCDEAGPRDASPAATTPCGERSLWVPRSHLGPDGA
ncbi:unnamed protein product [Mycena citricolor]|uniref:Uncharacterized protein n=1 Tax=Mycena citricolor TaxID=2018698 RepID=A0AAD2HTP0_9AGAR|nr:unnamed protein product [Mycena citricolor]CAK5280894.1 unnamed protein product [Mycena citricolor]